MTKGMKAMKGLHNITVITFQKEDIARKKSNVRKIASSVMFKMII